MKLRISSRPSSMASVHTHQPVASAFTLLDRPLPMHDAEARQLIVRGFLNEIIQKIGVGDVEDELTAVMEDELRIAQL